VPVLLTQQKLLDDGRLTINNQQSAVNSHPIVVCLDTDWEAIFRFPPKQLKKPW